MTTPVPFGRRLLRWLAILVVLLLLAVGAALAALWRWTASADFRARVQAQASEAVGVPVTLGAIHVAVWPAPAVAVQDVRVAPPAPRAEPITLGRVDARPDWAAVLAGRPALAALRVQDAALNEAAAAAIVASLTRLAPRGPVEGPADTRWLPRRLVLQDVRWTGTSGATSRFDGEALLAPDGLPRSAQLQITGGPQAGTRAALSPPATDTAPQPGDAAGAPRWQLRVQIGGGTVEGPVWLALADAGPAAGSRAGAAPATASPRVNLSGRLAVRGVDPAALTAPQRPLSGRLTADTRFAAQAASFGGVPEALTSSTRFSVAGARLHGIDLMKAVQTVGLSRGGETALETLSGEVHTRGRSAQVRELVARSGVLTARGDVAIAADRRLSGRVSVDLAESVVAGVVGVPLVVGGTLAAPWRRPRSRSHAAPWWARPWARRCCRAWARGPARGWATASARGWGGCSGAEGEAGPGGFGGAGARRHGAEAAVFKLPELCGLSARQACIFAGCADAAASYGGPRREPMGGAGAGP